MYVRRRLFRDLTFTDASPLAFRHAYAAIPQAIPREWRSDYFPRCAC